MQIILNEHLKRLITSSESLDECSFLSEKEKTVLLKRLKENWIFSKIALEIGVSPTQVKHLYQKGLNKLKLHTKKKAPDLLIKESLLSERVKNALMDDSELICLRDFDQYSFDKLLKKRNIGVECIKEIKEYILELGYKLKDSDSKDKTAAVKKRRKSKKNNIKSGINKVDLVTSYIMQEIEKKTGRDIKIQHEVLEHIFAGLLGCICVGKDDLVRHVESFKDRCLYYYDRLDDDVIDDVCKKYIQTHKST